MISPIHIATIVALDSDVCPTSVPSPVAPLNTYTFLKDTSVEGRPETRRCAEIRRRARLPVYSKVVQLYKSK